MREDAGAGRPFAFKTDRLLDVDISVSISQLRSTLFIAWRGKRSPPCERPQRKGKGRREEENDEPESEEILI